MTSFYKGNAESDDKVQSIVVNIDRATNLNYPALRFPNSGRVVGVTIFGNVSTSGTNLIQASLLNGGVSGAGTIIVAPISSGTIVAGSAYILSVNTDGIQAYAQGEYAMVQLTTENATTDIGIQVDYRLDADSKPSS